MKRHALLVAAIAAAACNTDDGLTVHNADPVAAITSHADGDQVHEDQALTLRGTASDPDASDTLTAEWWGGEDPLCDPAPVGADGTTTCEAALSDDQGEVTLVVRDQDGASGDDRVSLVIVPGGVPLVDVSQPDPDATWFSDHLVSFEATVEDTEDEPSELALEWSSSLDGVLDLDTTPDSAGRVADSTSLSQGQHEITLRATDTTGKTGSDSVVIEVLAPNTAPSCEILAPADGSVGEYGEVVTFEAQVSDPDQSAGSLSASWASDKDGGLGTSTPDSSGEVTLATGGLSQNTHLVTLTVTDEWGASCTDDVLYTVGTPPTITLSSPSDGDVVGEGEELVFTARVVDPDHAPGELDLEWSSDVDGVFSTEGPDTSGNVSFATDDLSADTHAITVTATDPDGFYGRDVVTVTVNGLPSAPVVSIDPSSPGTDDDLVVDIDTASVDPEGASVTYAYQWYRNGSPSSASTTDTLPSSSTTKGQTWSVEVTPSDPHGSGEPGTDSVEVVNTPPTAPVADIDPDDPIEGEDDFTCLVDTDSTDADGDSVSYTITWTVDGSSFSGATTTYETDDTVEASDTEAEEEWECTITPSDGDDDGTAATDSLYVLGVPVDYAHVQYPCSDSIARTTGTVDVYGWVYHPGVTDDYGEGPGITAEVGLGDDGTDPETHSSWSWVTATYNDDKPAYGDSSYDPAPYNNDEYVGTLTAPSSTGSYDYAYRFSTDSGLSWVYVDLGGVTCGGDGTIDGYDSADAGDLTVVP